MYDDEVISRLHCDRRHVVFMGIAKVASLQRAGGMAAEARLRQKFAASFNGFVSCTISGDHATVRFATAEDAARAVEASPHADYRDSPESGRARFVVQQSIVSMVSSHLRVAHQGTSYAPGRFQLAQAGRPKLISLGAPSAAPTPPVEPLEPRHALEAARKQLGAQFVSKEVCLPRACAGLKPKSASQHNVPPLLI